MSAITAQTVIEIDTRCEQFADKCRKDDKIDYDELAKLVKHLVYLVAEDQYQHLKRLLGK